MPKNRVKPVSYESGLYRQCFPRGNTDPLVRKLYQLEKTYELAHGKVFKQKISMMKKAVDGARDIKNKYNRTTIQINAPYLLETAIEIELMQSKSIISHMGTHRVPKRGVIARERKNSTVYERIKNFS